MATSDNTPELQKCLRISQESLTKEAKSADAIEKLEEHQALPAKPPKCPNKGQYDLEMEYLQCHIDELEEEKRKLNNRMQSADDFQELRSARLKSDQKYTLVDEKLKEQANILSKQREELSRLRDKLRYRSEQQVNSAITRLQNQLQRNNYKLRDEEKIVREINELRKSRKAVKEYDEKKKELDGTQERQRALRIERDKLFKELSEIKQREKSMRDTVNSGRQRLDQIKQELDDLHSQKRSLASEYKRNVDEHKKYYEIKRLERQRAASASTTKTNPSNKKQIVAGDQRVPTEPYSEELRLTSTLIGYLTKYTLSVTIPTRSLPSTPSTPSLLQDSEGGTMFVLNKKDNNDQQPLLERKSSKKKRERRPSGKCSKPVKHSPEIFCQFSKLELSPPTAIHEIPASIEQLKAKKKYYQMLSIREKDSSHSESVESKNEKDFTENNVERDKKSENDEAVGGSDESKNRTVSGGDESRNRTVSGGDESKTQTVDDGEKRVSEKRKAIRSLSLNLSKISAINRPLILVSDDVNDIDRNRKLVNEKPEAASEQCSKREVRIEMQKQSEKKEGESEKEEDSLKIEKSEIKADIEISEKKTDIEKGERKAKTEKFEKEADSEKDEDEEGRNEKDVQKLDGNTFNTNNRNEVDSDKGKKTVEKGEEGSDKKEMEKGEDGSDKEEVEKGEDGIDKKEMEKGEEGSDKEEMDEKKILCSMAHNSCRIRDNIETYNNPVDNVETGNKPMDNVETCNKPMENIENFSVINNETINTASTPSSSPASTTSDVATDDVTMTSIGDSGCSSASVLDPIVNPFMTAIQMINGNDEWVKTSTTLSGDPNENDSWLRKKNCLSDELIRIETSTDDRT